MEVALAAPNNQAPDDVREQYELGSDGHLRLREPWTVDDQNEFAAFLREHARPGWRPSYEDFLSERAPVPR